MANAMAEFLDGLGVSFLRVGYAYLLTAADLYRDGWSAGPPLIMEVAYLHHRNSGHVRCRIGGILRSIAQTKKGKDLFPDGCQDFYGSLNKLLASTLKKDSIWREGPRSSPPPQKSGRT